MEREKYIPHIWGLFECFSLFHTTIMVYFLMFPFLIYTTYLVYISNTAYLYAYHECGSFTESLFSSYIPPLRFKFF